MVHGNHIIWSVCLSVGLTVIFSFFIFAIMFFIFPLSSCCFDSNSDDFFLLLGVYGWVCPSVFAYLAKGLFVDLILDPGLFEGVLCNHPSMLVNLLVR